MVNLRRLDLNLLVTLDVLLAELNVTRAAERLHISQPAVSVHLAKLREVLEDRYPAAAHELHAAQQRIAAEEQAGGGDRRRWWKRLMSRRPAA